ncbi:hypothetical protein [Frischella perrara]|uniref:hypothetical protein n=1 Tax=Frischella perrara TaxID=1267021 RepID=UPI0023F040AF|nr:hypothetical protein [Frischella perrara]
MKYIKIKKIAFGMLFVNYFFNIASADNNVKLITNHIKGRAPVVFAPSIASADPGIVYKQSVDIAVYTVDGKVLDNNKRPRVGDALELSYYLHDEDGDNDRFPFYTAASVMFGYKNGNKIIWEKSEKIIPVANYPRKISVQWNIPQGSVGSRLAYRITPIALYGDPRIGVTLVGLIDSSSDPKLFTDPNDPEISSFPEKNEGTGGGKSIQDSTVKDIDEGSKIMLYHATLENGQITVGNQFGDNDIPKVSNYYVVKVVDENNVDITAKYNYVWSLVDQSYDAIGANKAEEDVINLVTEDIDVSGYQNRICDIVYKIPVNSKLKSKNSVGWLNRSAGAQGYHLKVEATYKGNGSAQCP